MVEITKKLPFHRQRAGNDLCVVPVDNGTYSTDRVDSLAKFGFMVSDGDIGFFLSHFEARKIRDFETVSSFFADNSCDRIMAKSPISSGPHFLIPMKFDNCLYKVSS